MPVKKISRRFFLAASGGTLAIPFLRSLLSPSEAKASNGDRPRCFIVLSTGHGGILPGDFYPERPTNTDSVNSWNMRYGNLPYEVAGTDARVSNVISAPASRLTPEIAGKCNLIAGIDYSPRTVGHNFVSHLGGYTQGLLTAENKLIRDQFKPSIDQIIGRSQDFYQSPPGLPVVGIGRSGSSYFTNTSDRSGHVVLQPSYDSPSSLWSALFRPAGPVYDDRPMDHVLVVDQAFDAYSELTSGAFGDARRLSGDDKERLEAHMATLFDIERQFQASSLCEAPVNPGNMGSEYGLNDTSAFWAQRAALIRQSIACGICRVFCIRTTGTFSSVGFSDFHQQVPHRSNASLLDEGGTPIESVVQARAQMRNYYQGTFEKVVLPLIEAMNFESQGCNVLDESLLMWTSECGIITHASLNVPLFTAGGLGGKVSTGQFLDYQNLESVAPQGQHTDAIGDYYHPGLPYDQFLGNLLNLYDVPVEEYDELRFRTPGGERVIGGFGGYAREEQGHTHEWFHDEAVRLAADEPLPHFVA